MTLHLIKMAVGIADLDHLIEYRRKRRLSEGGEGPYRILTRHRPRRDAEVLDGGSIFWVIRGLVRARQRILGLGQERDGEGRRCCVLELDHALVPTEPLPHRPFQGWRYLDPGAAPSDRQGGGGDALPPALIRELRALGLL
ncbi:MAG: DUF1489 domain-containing protein [Alphaproteobacteria bacterium]|nr:DUF1489 domain-containing protein [Alphaproteobacteria bacterium]